jgi:AcrR family transcriptional regulator
VAKENLQVRKQQLVRHAIYDAAIDLFAVKGFDETTVEEIAQAAGVSRRSFFRYFASKDDLLAQSVVSYAKALSEAIGACPAAASPLEVVRETVLSTARLTAAQPRAKQIIEISARSASARQAHQSRMMDAEDHIAEAFAKRLKSKPKHYLKPRLLASLTFLIMNVAIISWFRGEHQNIETAAEQALGNLKNLFCEPLSSVSAVDSGSNRRRFVAKPVRA